MLKQWLPKQLIARRMLRGFSRRAARTLEGLLKRIVENALG